MKNKLKDYFYFNKTERKGIITLFIIMGLLLVVKQSLVYFSSPLNQENDIIAMLKDSTITENIEIKNVTEVSKTESLQDFPDKPFNPNNLTQKEWLDFGLSEKQVAVVLNYKTKIDGFKSKEDLKKVYVIDDELFNKLEPYIQLPEVQKVRNASEQTKRSWSNEQKNNTSFNKWKPKVYRKVLINSADTAAFKTLYGIGEVLAARIVEHRNKLGGFISKNQLNEVYGLTSETLEKLDTLLVVDLIEIKKLNVNEATVDELKSHPYIYWKQANAIVKYRKQHGEYKQLADLKKSVLITDSIYNKIIPYIKLE